MGGFVSPGIIDLNMQLGNKKSGLKPDFCYCLKIHKLA
jgi:hypothetical protein